MLQSAHSIAETLVHSAAYTPYILVFWSTVPRTPWALASSPTHFKNNHFREDA